MARKPRMTAARRHYLAHKEAARELVHAKLQHWNQYYGYVYGRVSIKMVKTRWGSCSSNRNLNFNYKIMFLPEHLQDYIIVHELCHLEQMNHSPAFWALVAKTIPDYKKCVAQLKNQHIKIS